MKLEALRSQNVGFHTFNWLGRAEMDNCDFFHKASDFFFLQHIVSAGMMLNTGHEFSLEIISLEILFSPHLLQEGSPE